MDLVQEIKRELTEDAEQLVNSVFPRKTAQLDGLLNSMDFQLENLRSVATKSQESLNGISLRAEICTKEMPQGKDMGEQPLKKLKRCATSKGDQRICINQGGVSSNALISHLADTVRPEIISLMEYCNTVRTWVLLLLPKMEDGNNFGVSVQEETMAELKGVEAESAVFLESITSYFFSRAKVCSKFQKHPNISDYARFIAEEDEKQFVGLRHTVAELRNFYSSLHDLIAKNIEKIKRPRNNNSSSMY